MKRSPIASDHIKRMIITTHMDRIIHAREMVWGYNIIIPR